jgi:NAD+ synthase (glutamine-hydrolysing)
MRVAGAQVNLTVGDLDGNEAAILAAMERAEAAGADVLLLPELAVTGYPPEDLLLRPAFVAAARDVVDRLAAASGTCTTVVGFPAAVEPDDSLDAYPRSVANAAAVMRDGRVVAVYEKVLLPSYGVFDESRYFRPGRVPDQTVEIAGATVGVSVCEDVWDEEGPPLAQARAGAEILLNINASPFHHGKAAERERLLGSRARGAGAPLVYLNLVGGQDELVFDGCSMVIDASGAVVHRSPQFEEDFFVVDLATGDGGTVAPLLEPEEELYTALTTGLADYVDKNGFGRVVIGLSGGIDSALTAAIAVDALGSDRVVGVAMPSGFSSDHSVADAERLAANLGIEFHLLPIGDVYDAFVKALSPVFGDRPFGLAEENVQARTRGVLLMGISNKLGPMVLTTGNKSELAVGYATLYGDMAGGFSVLKDVLKTRVYALARWRNRGGEVIPDSSITKPPSAELRPDQRDADSLPPYAVLDGILERYVERDMSVRAIIEDGYDESTVVEVAGLVDRNEYKRRQAAPGVRVTTKAFGKDRRLPITNHYRRG